MIIIMTVIDVFDRIKEEEEVERLPYPVWHAV